MKVSNDFVLRSIAGEYLLIPVGMAALNTKGMIGITESGYTLFNKLQEGASIEELIKLIVLEYDVDESTAKDDIHEFLNKLRHLNILEAD